MGQSTASENQEYFIAEGVGSDVYFTTMSVKEYAGESEKIINKVHSIIKSLNIHMTRYYSELFEQCDTISNFRKCLKRSRIKNFDLNASFSRETFKSEEIKMKIEALKIEITRL